jgi:hypothetical protein
MANKTTKREYFAQVTEVIANADISAEQREELTAFINHEVELLDRKSSKNSLTATQKANLDIIENIYDALVDVGHPVTISELMASNAEMGQYTNQKLSALLKKLVDEGRVTKSTDKKKSYFEAVVEG